MYEPIAIIGYGVLYPPNSDNVQNFWKNIKNGVQGIREVTNEVWNCLLYTYPSPRDRTRSRMPSSA